MAFGIDDAIATGLQIVDKLIPDPAAKAAAALEAVKLQQAGEFKAIEASIQTAQLQTDVNKVEAASSSLFVSGWRPWIGWVCGMGLAYTFIAAPLLTFGVSLLGKSVVAPSLDMGTLLTLLLGMLGLGGMRTAEKMKGVS